MGLFGVEGGIWSGNPRIPEVLAVIYQSMIAGITPALVLGAIAERGRFLPTVRRDL